MSAPTPAAVAPGADDDARRRVATELAATLFVDAGAGTGKTTALVGRVLALVADGVPLREIATITFTEAAAAELRQRVREGLEARVREEGDSLVGRRCAAALAEADQAAISTLHAFAARVLREHSFDVGLPPRFEVADEVASQLAFATRWRDFMDAIYADDELARPLTWAHLLDIRLSRPMGASIERIARMLDQSWDRLVDLGPELDRRTLPSLPRAALAEAIAAVRAIDVEGACRDPEGDRLACHLAEIASDLDVLAEVVAHGTDEQLIARLCAGPSRVSRWTCSYGRQGSWDDIEAVRGALVDLADAVDGVKAVANDAVLRLLTAEVGRATLAAAETRRETGVLEFHDLLVLARGLLRDSSRARAALHERYRRVLIDEFQDTDPLQVELAALIASGIEGSAPRRWEEVDAQAGRLFFVGDPKQSIYRFRRADISVYLRARERFGGDGPLALSRNFRTEPTVLAWINHLFGAVMGEGTPDAQPEYQPLEAARAADPDHDHRVVLLGRPHERDEGLRAEDLRELEAGDVAAAIDAIRCDPERWVVDDPVSHTPRPARLDDITILVPTRLSLRYLRGALEARGLPHRVETGSLIFDTPEVRDLVTILRAVADPADTISLVGALRSPAFACGDDDLFTYHEAGGRWDLRAAPPAGIASDHPVVLALDYLRTLHRQRPWLEPAELLARIVAERRVLELGFGRARPRDVWRRVRYLLDQARAFTESQGGDLLTFLDWVELASADGARVHEPVLAEPDDVSVRIMTIHGAKGLEFPITIVAGTSTRHQNSGSRFGLHWDEDGRPHVSMRKGVSTETFDRLADLESEMDLHEKVRLLYVATTRARDYLLVGAHSEEGRQSFAAMLWEHSESAPEGTWRVWDEAEAPPVEPERAAAEAPDAVPDADAFLAERDAWIAARRRALRAAARPRVVSATALAKAVRSAGPAGDGEDGEPAAEVAPEPDLAPAVDAESEAAESEETVAEESAPAADQPGGSDRPWRRGRGATAFGRAVHAVLQSVDLATGDGADALAAAQCALEGIPDAAADVTAAVHRVLTAPIVQQAATGRSWRETYVAAPIGDRVLEGYVDLLVEAPDGLVVVDYKTDAVADEAAAWARAEHYRGQGAAYAVALEQVTGRSVVECVFVFAADDGPIEVRLADLDAAKVEVSGRLTAPIGA